MTESRKLYEDKTWEETAGPNSDLNPNSYAAQAAFGFVGMAVHEIHTAGIQLRPETVDALAGTLQFVVGSVQEVFTGKTSLHHGLNTRLRGALHTALETMPVPFGGTDQDWETWVRRIIVRVTSIANASLRLWDNANPAERPWSALAVSPALRSA